MGTPVFRKSPHATVRVNRSCLEMSPRAARNYCQDPFDCHHPNRVLKGVQRVSARVVSEVNDDRVGTGAFLCVSCRKRLLKDPKCLPPRERSSPIPSSSQQRSPSLPSDNDPATQRSSSSVESEVARQETSEVLHLLGETPLRPSKKKCPYCFRY